MKDYEGLSPELKKKLVDNGYQPWFPSMESLEEAQDYFNEVVETLEEEDQISVHKAFNILENTRIRWEVEVQTDDIFPA